VPQHASLVDGFHRPQVRVEGQEHPNECIRSTDKGWIRDNTSVWIETRRCRCSCKCQSPVPFVRKFDDLRNAAGARNARETRAARCQRQAATWKKVVPGACGPRRQADHFSYASPPRPLYK